jgi:peroxiredoxin
MLVRSLVFLMAFQSWLWNARMARAADTDGPIAGNVITRIPIPRRDGLGAVRFPISHTQPETQVWFEQGVALLHGDDRSGADRSFFQAIRTEPDCAMAWWGLAIANEDDRPLADHFIRQAALRQAAVTPREQLWIDALRVSLDSGTSEVDWRSYLVTAYDRLATQYPDDLEAYAFLARQLLQNRDAGLPLPTTTTAEMAIDRVLRESPDHPALHYKLKLWQDQYPERALATARQVQKALPGQPRVLTTAGKIFAALDRPEEALASLELSLATVEARRLEDRVTLFEVPGTVENVALQVDQRIRLGQVHDAVLLCQRMIESPYPEAAAAANRATGTSRSTAGVSSHAMRAVLKPRQAGPTHPTLTGQLKLLEILVNHGRWSELLDLANRGYFVSQDPEIRWRSMHAVGLAALSRRDEVAVAAQRDQLREVLGGLGPVQGSMRSVQQAARDRALRELEWCASAASSQGVIVEPCPSAQLGDLFPALVLKSIEGPNTVATPVDLATGPRSVARGLSRIRQLAAAESIDVAIREYDSLKQQFPQLDDDILSCSGITIGVGDQKPSPSGIDPVQTSFPSPALSLPDRHGAMISLESLRGRPVVLVFYLGAGCPHCIEQLRSFAPLKQEYEQAGATIVAVSTDSVAGLKETFEVTGADSAIPFQLVSDEALTAFRDFGAYDVRDQKPLHGTFLISPAGHVVWHNIRREPFMATRVLLDEILRVGAIRSGSTASPPLGVTRSGE